MISTFGLPPASLRSAAASSSARTCVRYSRASGRRGARRASRASGSTSRALRGVQQRDALFGVEAAPRRARESSTSGRNSCSGGSRRRTVTGSPSIASRMPTKSDRCSLPSSASAACSSASSAARMNRWTSGSRSPRNMCSVRHRPMPSAPKRRATCVVGQVGVGAHAERAELVGPAEDHVERSGRLRRDHRHRADDDSRRSCR